jgi:hypothetical protein
MPIDFLFSKGFGNFKQGRIKVKGPGKQRLRSLKVALSKGLT